ncbi:uncharacterized protein LOC129774897 [Toxorhynchites rutilus septentrionalis]|uniref:uncharacterized protein LOC129774897 n=1 Tax=Toxorhynchites rutilus septentrionalis TaxID=329112 RepID=UPI00247ABD4E|nr:uncharacterized protein LOC129774897 [Toxorhynchites rutilus septentrionalis]
MNHISVVLIAALATLIPTISGHGMVVVPPNRSSRWRCNPSAPTNWNDNELWCGGLNVQWNQNGGRCGHCGDDFAHGMPRNNELGGIYGQGEIVANYTQGSEIQVDVRITQNHLGYFEFNLCDLSRGSETAECFERTPLLDCEGRRHWYLNSTLNQVYKVCLKLPEDVVCEHCVIQWTYVTGNNWGICPDGTGAIGCGPQEHFRSCSDIGIYNAGDDRLSHSFNYCPDGPRTFDWIDGNLPEENFLEQK